MDYQQIDVLEDKINMAVELLAKLKSENQELKQRIADLLQKLDASEQAFQQMKADYEAIQNNQDDYIEIKQREERVREKVEGMLNKLNAIQLSL